MAPKEDISKLDLAEGYTTEDDAPLTPPKEILGLIPPFQSCGTANCGAHTYPEISNQPDVGGGWDWPTRLGCLDCKREFAIQQLHGLGCGHVICLFCLHLKVYDVWDLIQLNRSELHEVLQESTEVRRRLSRARACPHEERARLKERHAQLGEAANALAGLTCCGVDMKLWNYAACLESETARMLWFALAWMADAPRARHMCGWPDCKKFIPSILTWSSQRTVRGRYYYCPSCEASSQMQLAKLTEEEDSFPWLRRGQGLLCPARG